jgi:outer membrane lipoprotein-sorting protein
MARSGFVSLLPFFFPSPLLDASRLTLIVLFATLGSLLASGSTSAAGYPEPKQPYSADLTMRLSDGSGNEQYTSRGREYYSKGNRRREMTVMGRETVRIERPDQGLSWTLIPSTKTYLEHREGQSRRDGGEMPDPLGNDENVALKKIGAETVNGVEAGKYQVEMEDGKGTAWMTAQNIPVRFVGTMEAEGRTMEIRIDYENIRVGPQGAALFERPSGYTGAPAFAIPGMTGAPPPGADGRAPTDAEIEAYQQQMRDSMEQMRQQMEQMRTGQ